MDRNDFIETREDIVQNIKTLYSYLDGKVDSEHKDWAIQRMSRGSNYVIEVVDSQIYFAPSRFVGYVDNTMEKHVANHGNGTETDNKIKIFYQKVQDVKLDVLLQKAMSEYDIVVGAKKYWISKDTTVDDIVRIAQHGATYSPLNMKYDKYWHIQMHLPEGKNGTEIDPTLMLLEKDPVIGTGEWDDKQCDNFKHIDNGNIVLVRKGGQAIALCQITGENFTDPNLSEKYINENFRKVHILAWANEYKQPRPGLFTQGTFSPCGERTEQYKYIDGWLENIKNKAFTNKCADLLKSKHNIILQGAPGTGKTYNTAAIALSVLGIDGVDLDNHDEVMKKYEELQDDRIFFTTFHQSLDYEDFVEGLKPRVQTNENGESLGVTYEPEDGIFKRACNAVVTDDSKDIIKSVVLIIDEINRGNVSKIFGELITLLEADKRDKGNHPIKVTLPYSKTLFGVPSNLYIIGTMNTTDRSTGTLDYAIRRRFAFVTLKSDPNVIVKHYEKLGNDDLKAIAIDLFNNIKAFITNPKHLCGDLCIDDLMVGHSYFMASSKEELQCKVEFEIIPLIAEYINDGILTVNDQEKEKAFDAWASLQPVQIVDDEDEDNIDEEDE
ncbi:McrB family protein [Prevotella sp.]|uniref:McrB family protein n=1 Tax=Prevotella sp. TaxID=59823 RepID=UPI0027E2E3BD|nr:AAA family ATPase [Prevotella sp.]